MGQFQFLRVEMWLDMCENQLKRVPNTNESHRSLSEKLEIASSFCAFCCFFRTDCSDVQGFRNYWIWQILQRFDMALQWPSQQAFSLAAQTELGTACEPHSFIVACFCCFKAIRERDSGRAWPELGRNSWRSREDFIRAIWYLG